MGGILALTVRQKNGMTHRMSGWTNEFPPLINNVNIKDDNHFDTFIQRYHEDREHPNNLYSDHATLAPTEYGLIVVDYETKNMVYINGYFTVGEFYLGSLYNDATSACGVAARCDLIPEMLQAFNNPLFGITCYNFGEFLKQKKITQMLQFEMEPGAERGKYAPSTAYTAEQLNNMSAEEFIREFLIGDYAQIIDKRFEVQLADFTVTRYEESKDGFDKLKNHIQNLGFVLTPEDNIVWDNYMKARFDEEEDDE